LVEATVKLNGSGLDVSMYKRGVSVSFIFSYQAILICRQSCGP